MSNLLRVCATPEVGFWTVDGDATRLLELVNAAGGNLSMPCGRLGSNPRLAWTSDESDNFPIVGYAAELLVDVVADMGSGWDCRVDFLPTFTAALYATTKQKLCDIAYAPFSVTASRAYCGATPVATTSVAACPPYDPNVTWVNATAAQACCADFGYNMLVTSVAGMVSRVDNVLATSAGVDWKLVADLINIIVVIAIVTIVLSHIVWLAEKASPETNRFPRDYLPGIFETIWLCALEGMGSERSTAIGRELFLELEEKDCSAFPSVHGVFSACLPPASFHPFISPSVRLTHGTHGVPAPPRPPPNPTPRPPPARPGFVLRSRLLASYPRLLRRGDALRHHSWANVAAGRPRRLCVVGGHHLSRAYFGWSERYRLPLVPAAGHQPHHAVVLPRAVLLQLRRGCVREQLHAGGPDAGLVPARPGGGAV